ncbi:MAG TPA: Rieske (2Fe-2S) protein [Gaiellaceae bacterium]|jgi:nitrite reductase/ring-hydroxylating ferredoxin subunit|nr:Rieske (2Fe-2S) protein [Gaiellaceae bacterium]
MSPVVRVPADRGRAVVEVDGRAIAVFRDGDRVWAVDASCPHAGNPLVEGEILGTTLVCAFHGWRFDLETGACLHGERPLRCYRAELREGEVWLDLGTTS